MALEQRCHALERGAEETAALMRQRDATITWLHSERQKDDEEILRLRRTIEVAGALLVGRSRRGAQSELIIKPYLAI